MIVSWTSRLQIDKIVNDGIAINYKQRSKVNNVGKESNMKVETETKSVHNSLDIEVADEQTVNDGTVQILREKSDTCKAVKKGQICRLKAKLILMMESLINIGRKEEN